MPSLFSALLLQVTSSSAWAEAKEWGKLLMPVLLFLGGRWWGQRDKNQQKIDEETAAVKELKAKAELNIAQHTTFVQQYEQMQNTIGALGQRITSNEANTLENKSRIEATKEGLARVEGQLSQLLTNLLNRK